LNPEEDLHRSIKDVKFPSSYVLESFEDFSKVKIDTKPLMKQSLPRCGESNYQPQSTFSLLNYFIKNK
jgi:hypothetical protein